MLVPLNNISGSDSVHLGKAVARQRFLLLSIIASTADDLAADLAFLSARFSFRDLPDFFVIPCRGDLSDIVGPS
jgi:hypothetical protein